MRATVLALIAAASLAGCNPTASTAWYRTDGSVPAAEQLSLDQTICKGEVQKANLTSSSGFSVQRAFEERDAFTGCMAQRGLVLREVR